MKVKAVRLHAANDLRLDTFELPEIKDDEILVKVVSDSICMSTYKCAILGTGHKRVHPDVAEHPAIMGHEFAGDIVKVGSTVGAGDSVVAALAYAEETGMSEENTVRLSIATGAANVMCSGTQAAERSQIEELLPLVTFQHL